MKMLNSFSIFIIFLVSSFTPNIVLISSPYYINLIVYIVCLWNVSIICFLLLLM